MEDIKSYFIDPVRQTLLVASDEEKYTFTIDGNKNSDEELKLILEANRRYVKTLMMKNVSQQSNFDGCLPSVCLNVPLPSVNVSPKYLINCFIAIIKLLFNDFRVSRNHDPFFIRDETTIDIPTSSDKMQLLMETVMNTVGAGDSESFDVKNIFRMFMQQFAVMENKLQSRTDKLNKMRKRCNMVGGLGNVDDAFATVNQVSDFKKSLNQCAVSTHELIGNQKKTILQAVLDENNPSMVAMKQVYKIITADAKTPIYYNTDISLDVMFAAIGEIFNVLFLNVAPQTSMMDSLLGSFYHTAVLNELKLLERFSDIIQWPVLYRITYCCFKAPTDDEATQRERERYLRENYPSILNHVNRLGDDRDKNLQGMCNISVKTNFQDQKLLEALYYALDEKRHCTYEFYVVMMGHLYAQCFCCDLKRENKISNVKKFIQPLHEIMTCYYQHVNQIGLQNALCSETFDTFSKLNDNELRETAQNFMNVVQNLAK